MARKNGVSLSRYRPLTDDDYTNLLSIIWSRYFDHIQPSKIHHQPVAIFVGGQPGSGKSELIKRIHAGFDKQRPNTTMQIIADDYRPFIPGYGALLDKDDLHAASVVDKDAGKLAEMVIKKAVKMGANCIIEGTFRNPATVTKTAKLYRNKGYETQAVLLMVHPFYSRLGILERYIGQRELNDTARFTVSSAHDNAFDGITKTVPKILSSQLFDRFYLTNRAGSIFNEYRPDTDDHDDILQVMQDFYGTLTSRHVKEIRAAIEVLEAKIAHNKQLKADLNHKIFDDIKRLRQELA
jgi:predicted kinase